MKKYVFSAKEVGLKYGLTRNEMWTISKFFNIGKKCGQWLYTYKDMERLETLLTEYGRTDKSV